MNFRTTRLVAVAASALIGLSGCALLGPERGPDGQVLETSVIGSTRLLVGDCFSFVDGTNLADASVTPCTQEHAYIVIGGGALTDSAITDAGSLQNAVSVSCGPDFESVQASVTEGVRPEQEFIVWSAEVDGESLTNYLCVATDAAGDTSG